MQSRQESGDDGQREFTEKLQQHQSQVTAAQQSCEAATARYAEVQAEHEAIIAQKQIKEEQLRTAQSRCMFGWIMPRRVLLPYLLNIMC
jgi:hypothetical protein